jgi:hypothetical protein
MRLRTHHLLVAVPLLLSACGSGLQNSTEILGNRLQAQLGSQVQSGDVAITRKPDGAAVTLLRPSPGAELSERDQYLLASAIEGLIDPTLVQIQVTDTQPGPVGYEPPRVQATTAYFKSFAINATPLTAAPAGVPQGLTVDITVHCPPSHSAWNWGYNAPYPTCW